MVRYVQVTQSKLKEVKKLVKNRISNNADPQHGWKHVQRVAYYAQKIVKSLKLENKLDLNLVLAPCYLHDINRAYYSPTLINYFLETRNSKSVLPSVLAELDIDGEEKTVIENAIYSSSFSFPFKRLNKDKDLYTQILQDADTLDFFSKEREDSFKKARKDFSFYAFLGLFSNLALKYGRKNIENYLNFPQLAQESYVQKS